MHELGASLPRSAFESICAADLVSPALSLARHIRSLLGDTCVPIPLPSNDCVAFEQRADGTETPVTFELVPDAACSASGVRLVTSAPSEGTMVSLRCTNS
jgi:hypothetical protein